MVHCEITVTLDFIFLPMLYSHEDVSFNTIFLNVLEGIKQFNLSMCFMKNRLETPFKGDNIKALINETVKNSSFISLKYLKENCSICYAFLAFSDQTIA